MEVAVKRWFCWGLLVIFMAGVPAAALAGKIVVANDEWTLSDTGFNPPNDAGAFAVNVANWFTGGSGGNFYAYSNNLGLTGTSLATAMTAAGNTWTVGTGITFDLATLSTYDAIFVGGVDADNTVLISYVNAGGNVYVMGGTGQGGDDNWNTFLNTFGLNFASYANGGNGITGDIPINSTHAIFAEVDSLYQDNGQNVSLYGSVPGAQVLVYYDTINGLYGVYDPVPLPPTALLLGSGLLGLAGWRLRKRYFFPLT
jgi:hypothetical protein